MACNAFVQKFPAEKGPDSDSVVRENAMRHGLLCSLGYHNHKTCVNYCKDPTKTRAACFSCLSDSNTCGKFSGTDRSKEACCIHVKEAVTCSDCLSKYTTDSLAKCLSTKMSTASIVGISLGVLVFMVVLIGVSVVVVRQKKILRARANLVNSTRNTDAKTLIGTLDSGLGSEVFNDLLQRQKIMSDKKNNGF